MSKKTNTTTGMVSSAEVLSDIRALQILLDEGKTESVRIYLTGMAAAYAERIRTRPRSAMPIARARGLRVLLGGKADA